MKKIIVLGLALFLSLGTATVFADSKVNEEVKPMPVLISENVELVPTLYGNTVQKVYYNEALIEVDVPIQVINGVTMVPLRHTLEKMGYEVTWNGETQSIEILKGPNWTSIKIGENSYFKNKMAPRELSSEPVIVDGRTLVPAEFFTTILNKGIIIKNGDFQLNDSEVVEHVGYVKEINNNEEGIMSITITTDLDSEDIMNHTIIHTSEDYTYYNKTVVEGEIIHVVSSMVMTMSIPGQTNGYIVY